MKTMRSFASIAFGVMSITFLGQSLSAQQPTPADVREAPRNVVTEIKDAHKRWINNDVPYIITAAERKAFLALRTDDERESFINIFWSNRDPDPETEENEYRQEYYERIAYANEHFGSGIAGWKTDRGRIYITWGKPDSIEAHPSGGAYERPSYEGGGSTTTYPFETWFYRHLEGVGDGVEIEFVDPTGTGEYRIARNENDKDALAMVPGMGRKYEPANEPQRFQREQDAPLARLSRIAALSVPPNVRFTDLDRALTDSPVIDNNPLGFDLRIDHFRQSDDRVITTFTVQTSNSQLKFVPVGGIETATINIFGRVTAVTNKKTGIFEESVTATATSADLVETRDRSLVYQKALALAPGIYKVGVIVRDVATGNKGITSLGFTVPKYDERALSTSTLVLTSNLRAANENEIGDRFVIGGRKVIPNLSGSYKQGQDVGIYMQVYNAETDQTTLRPALDVSYVLSKDGKEVLRRVEDWSGLSDAGQRLTLANMLPTAGLAPGEYTVAVVIRDRVRDSALRVEGNITVIK
ncbi:MAG: GWxTD domain-containing protein [Pyrinomonadaceae bacterium]|nr:GWxTD domain-containing protein [Pyrinomonadaceae bacterium]MBP6214218.1 GWxTD domain-containing protein [Pyrinomonadaceae bacterium]